jgi:hypothetical protein
VLPVREPVTPSVPAAASVRAIVELESGKLTGGGVWVPVAIIVDATVEPTIKPVTKVAGRIQFRPCSRPSAYLATPWTELPDSIPCGNA